MPSWTKEQLSAINETGKNIIVSAGAGSGKTAVLSERVLEKVKNGVPVDRLLILTFTKAAASEMKERIRKKIRDNNLIEQLNKIDNSYITTFDSFSLSLVKKYHYLLNVKKNINIIESNVLNIKTREYLEEIMEEEYSKKDEDFIKLINDFTLKDDTELKKLILMVNDKLNMKYYKKEYLNSYIDNFYNDEFINNSIKEYTNYLINKISELNIMLTKLCDEVDMDYASKLIDLSGLLLNSKDYESIRENIINIDIPRLPRGSSDTAKNIKENIKDIADEIKELTIFSIDELKLSILNTKSYAKKIIDIINKLDEKLDKYKYVNDLYDFVDISKMAIKLVKENNEINKEIKEFFIEIMVDEYQDTSDLQEEFISLISNNNLYMVGDIKQSIYRFRNANPNIFRDKYNNYEKNNGGLKIDLLKNFRSREEVLNNINLIFDYIMDDMYGGANYIASHRMNFGNISYNKDGFNNQNNNFEVYSYNFDKEIGFTKDEIEAFIISNDIIKKVNSHYKIYDKDNNILREAKYSDFCILIDRSTTFELYKKIFLYKHLPLSIYKDEYLDSSDIFKVIKSIFKLLSSLNNKEKEYMFLSIGRSFLFNYSDDYLFNIIINNDYESTDIFKIINEIKLNIANKSITDILDEIIIKFDFYDKLRNTSSIEENTIKLDYLYNLSSTLNGMGYTYLDFNDFIDNLINNSDSIRFSLNNEESDSIKIMTIHKSKGLEFPICYFPGLYKEFNIMELKDRINYSNKYGIIFPYYDDGLVNNYLFSLYKKDYYDEEISEKIRLFYVALTRAKEKMIFIMPEGEKEEDYSNNIVSNYIRCKYKSFLDILLSIKSKITDYIENIDIKSMNISKDYNLVNSKNIFNDINKIDEKIVINNQVKIEKKIKNESHYSKSSIGLISREQQKAMEFGSMIHYYLETMDLKNPKIDDIEDIYKEKILNFLNSDLMKNKDNANIYQEYEFIYEEESTIKHGIIDLLMEYSDYFDIIDYKLKNIGDDAYIKQLNGYKDYISKISNKKVNIYLYSVMDGIYKKL